MADITDSIKLLKFENIKSKIEKLNKIYSIMLVVDNQGQGQGQGSGQGQGQGQRGLAGVGIVDVKGEILDRKVQEIMGVGVGVGVGGEIGIQEVLGVYEKLKVYDQEYGTNKTASFLSKIGEVATSIYQSAQQSAKNSQTPTQIDKSTLKVSKLQKILSSQLPHHPQLLPILNLVSQSKQKLTNFANIFLQNSKYNPQYLERLRTLDMAKFTEALEQLREEFVEEAKKVEEYVRRGNQTGVFQGLGNLGDLENVDKYIIADYYNSPKQYKQKILKKLQQQNKTLWLKIKSQFQQNHLQSNQTLQKFLNLQLASKGKICNQTLQKFHTLVVKYFNQTIPELPKTANLSTQIQRFLAIERHVDVLKILKDYVRKYEIEDVIDDGSNVSLCLGKIHLADQAEKQITQFIKQMYTTVQELWKQGKYRQIYNKLADLSSSKIPIALTAFGDLSSKLKQMIKQASNNLRTKITLKNFTTANQQLLSLQQCQSQLKTILNLDPNPKQPNLAHKQIQQQILKEVDDNVKVALKYINATTMGEVLGKIVEIRQWVDWFPVVGDQVEKRVRRVVMAVKGKKLVGVFVGMLESRSTSTQPDAHAGLCKQLLKEYSKQLQVPRILPKVTIQPHDAIQKFRGESEDAIKKKQLSSTYAIYQSQFQFQKELYIAKSTKQSIPQNLQKLKQKAVQLTKQIDTQRAYKQKIPKALANIFLYWSISKSAETYYELKEQNKEADDFLLQPHPIQVMAILRFVGCDREKKEVPKKILLDDLDNHVMQIKTGEGKSVILASMAILLALMGHKVDCVSYSTYLSQRDYEDFKSIFQGLGVIDNIQYGTFGNLAEKLINQKCAVRSLVDNLFIPGMNKKVKRNEEANKGSRILLVDQIDTFFSRDFYGVTYNPITSLQNKEISQIVDIIWKNRLTDSQKIKTAYKSSRAYKKLSDQYKDCFHRLDNQFSIMIQHAKNFESRDYIVQNGRIGYKELDGVTFTTFYGYQTMFTYIFEAQKERGNVKSYVAQSNIGIKINCGHYSYAEMVDSYTKIFGVTGTLEPLSGFEIEILKRYNITKKTFAPSVYGDSQRNDLPILIENDKSFHTQKIAARIDQELKNNRSLLVFFENQNQLKEFESSKYAERFRSQLRVVTEKTENRNYHIKKATSPHTVTLFTAPFGRGTDFVVYDPIVEKEGVLVIQTFLSEQPSEEIQIKGRTARQGNKGLYQLILNLQKLESKYKITKELIQKTRENANDTLTGLFQRERFKHLQQVNKERVSMVEGAKSRHIQSMEFKEKMFRNQVSRNEPFFFDNYNGGNYARILFIVDSTITNTEAFSQLKGRVIDSIKQLAGKYSNRFKVQFMAYYGHTAYGSQKADSNAWNDRNKIHASEWTSDSTVLKNFLNTFPASKKTDHEAIEVGLHHLLLANREARIAKGILIGDDGLADNNLSSMIYQVHPQDKHRYLGRQNTEISEYLKIGQLLTQLKEEKVSIDSYPIGGGRAFTTFQHISTLTKGKCTTFDPIKDNLAVEIQATIMQSIGLRK